MPDPGECEASFGPVIRDKANHDNYILLGFENIGEIIESYTDLKKQFKEKS